MEFGSRLEVLGAPERMAENDAFTALQGNRAGGAMDFVAVRLEKTANS